MGKTLSRTLSMLLAALLSVGGPMSFATAKPTNGDGKDTSKNEPNRARRTKVTYAEKAKPCEPLELQPAPAAQLPAVVKTGGVGYGGYSAGQSLATVNAPTPELLKRMAERDVIKEMIESRLLYSSFFIMIAGHLKLEPKIIALLSPEEVEEVAISIYEEMEKVFKTTSQIEKVYDYLPNVVASRTTFSKYSKQVVVDKIGESLIVQAAEGKFVAISNLSASEGVVVTTVFGLLGGAAGTIGYGLWWWSAATSYYSDDVGMLPQLFTGFASLLGGSIGMIAKYDGWLQRRVERRLTDQQIKMIEDPNRIERVVTNAFPRLQPAALKERIRTIAIAAKKLKPKAKTVASNGLITFGSASLDLHADLVNFFVKDFMLWMKMYEVHRETIKQKLIDIRDGRISSQNDQALKFLAQVFIEATEATSLALTTSEEMNALLELGRNTLNEYGEKTQLTKVQQTDLRRRVEILSDAIRANLGFQLGLIAMHDTISHALFNLDKIKGAETAKLIEAMSSKISVTVDDQVAIGEILSHLEKLDEQLDAIEVGVR